MSDEITKNKGGRPSTYSHELVTDFCKLLAIGNTLRSLCATDRFPTATTIYDWLEKFPEFAEQYARARSQQADHYAEMIIDEAFGASDASIGRLRMDALKWAASKIAPKKYGDKIEVESNQSNNIKLSFTIPHRDAPIDILELESPDSVAIQDRAGLQANNADADIADIQVNDQDRY
jgi:hypothetical protein